MNKFAERIFSMLYGKYKCVQSYILRINNNKKLKGLSWAFVILACFGILLALNIFTPLIADDFGYLYIFGEEGVRVTSIADIIHSQVSHYYLWGGRSVVHFIAQALLLLSPLVIDILNSFAYCSYVFLIYFHIKGHKAHSLIIFMLINLAIWFIQPAFGDTILWITGAANYLWGTCIILLFLLPYRFYEGKKESTVAIVLKSVGIFIFSILAGWTNENTAAGMLCIVGLLFAYYYSRKWTIPTWGVVGFIGALIGYVIMVIAPGNQIRAAEAGPASLFQISYRMCMYTLYFVSNLGLLNLFYIFLIILIYHFTPSSKSSLNLSFIFFAGAFVSIYVMIFSPSFPPRAWFGVITFNIIALGVLFYNLNYNYRFLRQIRMSILIVGMIAFSFSFYLAAKDIYGFYNLSQQRSVLVEQAKKRGDISCEFERYQAKTGYLHVEDYRSNFLMKSYYGMDISFKKEE